MLLASAERNATLLLAETTFETLWASIPGQSSCDNRRDVLRRLRTDNPQLYSQILGAHRALEAVAKQNMCAAIESIPLHSWVTVFDSCLWGPFNTSVEAIAFLKDKPASDPRTPITWQVGAKTAGVAELFE